MSEGSSELVVSRPAARAIGESLPEAVGAEVVEFITGALIDNPQQVGRPLRNELAGIHGARRGTYRVVYRIDETERTVTVLRIDHRNDAYRSRPAVDDPPTNGSTTLSAHPQNCR